MRFRDLIRHWLGWETPEQAYARIWAQLKREYPRETEYERIQRNLMELWAAEQKMRQNESST